MKFYKIQIIKAIVNYRLYSYNHFIFRRFRCVKVRGEGDEQVSDENLQDTSNESGKKPRRLKRTCSL